MRILVAKFFLLFLLIACRGGSSLHGLDLVPDPGAALDIGPGDAEVPPSDATLEDAASFADAAEKTAETLIPDLQQTDLAPDPASDPGGAGDVSSDGTADTSAVPEGFLLLPPGFSGIAGRLSVPSGASVVHPAGVLVSLVSGTAGPASAIATTQTDASGNYLLAFPSGFVPEEGMDLALVAELPGGALSVSYTGLLVDIDPAAAAARVIASSLGPLSFPARAFLADFARGICGRGRPCEPARLRPFSGGLKALLVPTKRSAASEAITRYALSVEGFRQALREFCATTDFSKDDVADFLKGFETYAQAFMDADAALDEVPLPSILPVGLQKLDFEMDVLVFLWMVADLADDNLTEGFATWKAVHSARAYCGYLDAAVPAVTLFLPEMAFEAAVAAAAEIEVPDDVPVRPEDLVEAGIAPPQGVKLEIVFVHPMVQEASHLAAEANAACEWQRIENWLCEVEKARGVTFECPQGQNCCDQCTCYQQHDGCSYFVGCYECIPSTGLTFPCYSKDELAADAGFAIPLANAFVGLLVDVEDRWQLFDDVQGKGATLDLYYDGVLIASTGGTYDMGPMYVGPPFDDPAIFATIIDPMLELYLSGFAKLHAPEVIEKVRFLVGMPSEVAAGEHRSLFLESRGDPFNGVLIVWRLSIADGPFSTTGVRDVTKPSCPQLSAPVSVVSQDQYLKGGMPYDLPALVLAAGQGLLQDHQIKAVLTLVDGSTAERTHDIPAPVSKLVCPSCEASGPAPGVSGAFSKACQAAVGEDYALQGLAQMKRIRNRLVEDVLSLASGELMTGLAEGALGLLDGAKVADGLKSLSLEIEPLFKSDLLNNWARRVVNRLGRFLEWSADEDTWSGVKKFAADLLSKIVDKLVENRAPGADLPLDAPAWIETAEQYEEWKRTVDNCTDLLCPWANGNLRLLRESMKVHGDATIEAMEAFDAFEEWASNAADTAEYSIYLRGTKNVFNAGKVVGALGTFTTLMKSVNLVAKVPLTLYQVAVIGRKIELGSQVIDSPGAFKSMVNPCGDPQYAVY